MKMSIVDRNGQLAAEHREFLERRLLFALSRFGSRIAAVSAAVDSEQQSAAASDATAGPKHTCHITVTLRRLPTVEVTGTGSDMEACLAHTVDRAGRSVSRVVAQNQPHEDAGQFISGNTVS